MNYNGKISVYVHLTHAKGKEENGKAMEAIRMDKSKIRDRDRLGEREERECPLRQAPTPNLAANFEICGSLSSKQASNQFAFYPVAPVRHLPLELRGLGQSLVVSPAFCAIVGADATLWSSTCRLALVQSPLTVDTTARARRGDRWQVSSLR